MSFHSERMTEATRLTRAGRLAEATSLLQGGAVPPAPAAARTRPTADPATGAPPPATPAVGSPPVGDRVRGLLSRLGTPATAPAAHPAAPGARFTRHTHTGRHGGRDYLLYVPSTVADGVPAPLVVMLHGGTQTAADFAAATGVNDLAERHGFRVAYPEQSRAANAMGYWNWFQPADQGRDGGEPALIAGIVREIPDVGRVFVAGFSAGAAMAAVLAATHPDVFVAAGVHSGVPYRAASDVPSAFGAMRDPRAGAPVPEPIPLIVFHGDADRTVAVGNADRLVDGRGAATVTTERGFTRTVYADAEKWIVHGSGHAWSGGTANGSYTDPTGPDASAEMVRFFLARA